MSDYIITEGGELCHYGVLGMKWGKRKAQRKGTTYEYHSYTTNKYNRKATKANEKVKANQEAIKELNSINKYRAAQGKKPTKIAQKQLDSANRDAQKYSQKAAKYEQRAKRSAELDKREQRIAEQMSTGKVVATRLLLTGGIGAKNYQQYRAMGADKKTAAVKTWLDVNFLGGIGSRVMKAAYLRQDEN